MNCTCQELPTMCMYNHYHFAISFLHMKSLSCGNLTHYSLFIVATMPRKKGERGGFLRGFPGAVVACVQLTGFYCSVNWILLFS